MQSSKRKNRHIPTFNATPEKSYDEIRRDRRQAKVPIGRAMRPQSSSQRVAWLEEGKTTVSSLRAHYERDGDTGEMRSRITLFTGFVQPNRCHHSYKLMGTQTRFQGDQRYEEILGCWHSVAQSPWIGRPCDMESYATVCLGVWWKGENEGWRARSWLVRWYMFSRVNV